MRYFSIINFAFRVFIFTLISHSFVCYAHSDGVEINDGPCFSNGWNKEKFEQLKDNQFALSRPLIRSLFPQLRYCLASNDPVIRDEVAYGAYSTWLRTNRVEKSQLTSLFETLLSDVAQNKADEHSVFVPFAVLVFSEVLRVDRKDPYLQSEQLTQAVNTMSSYIVMADDYRGFDEQLGWRHGVAHASDAALQLVLNPRISSLQLQQMLNAIAQQVRAKGGHFYIYSEPERLARPVYYAMRRKDVPIAYWKQWVNEVAAPAPYSNWNEVFTSKEGLAQRHNVKSFLLNLQNFISLGKKNDELNELDTVVQDALKTMI
ncbi:hypothetical protein FX988_01706 [Paraglaciecola mesophila]|uniref:DUF2785 domain-containing protein n=1 Tax=Paraglaciecola mesophila TaxID=197222 RepID=A0A857JKI2_9ALTE|nr:DUF2785 domain-containing protein [Paraglaciecola mesophila]QHJ11477.1 hypothetical protein FX988_01706 [Paraglaciecola mesophila]